ncbi:MAG: hypothetical protein ACR2OG_15350 [Gemmatimonadaceae bacterium]
MADEVKDQRKKPVPKEVVLLEDLAPLDDVKGGSGKIPFGADVAKKPTGDQ